MVITICVCIFYLVYRGLYTLNVDSPFAAVFSITLYLAEIYGNMLMFLYFFQIWEPINPEPVPTLKDAKVDAYIPTYNEEPELLRGTIVAALEMDYPHETYVLDDGNRPEVRKLTEELGAKYINRDSNIHAKAGNLNHAMEITDGEYIIVFDSDHIAERHFITRTLGYFADDDLAFIQTPHSYYNFDSFQGSLDYDKRFYWEEGQLFYNIVQPGRNYWNSASFCGSAAIFRKEALESVGLIATESITEDMQTGLRLHAQGWKSLYINERLVSGLAAPDIETFSVQRLRWGEGNLGTIFFDNPITAKGLTFPQRLNYLALMLSWTTGVQKLILYYTPLLMLITGVGPVADMTWTLVAITVVYVLNVWFTVKASGNGYGRLLDTEITQMATFWTQCRGTYRALFNRKKASFVVTQKSGGGKDSSIHDFLRPQYTFIGCSVVAVTWAAARYFLGVSEDFLGLSICSVLVGVHCVFAWIVIRRALAQRRFDWRHPCSAHIRYEVEGDDGIQIGEGVTKDLSETGVGFLSYEKLNGHKLKVTITAGDATITSNARICSRASLVDYNSRKEGEVKCFRYGVEFEDLGEEQLRNLWHICTKYAVARRYIEFDPNRKDGLLDPVRGAKDHSLTVAARLYRPELGDIHSVTESMTNTTFTMISEEKIKPGTLLRGQLSAPTGAITGNVRIEQAKPIDLGQMPLTAYRCKFDAFDGQSRGKLTTLLHLSQNPKMTSVTTLKPTKTTMPLAQPAAIIAVISTLAAVLTLIATFFLCGDQVLMARAILGKPIDESGNERLSQLVTQFERAPTSNERLFLRLRQAMLAAKDDDSISRLNDALIGNEFNTPAAKLQQAYALEELGRMEDARDAFANLIEDIEEFRSRKTRANVVLAAARNAANRRSYEESQKLYQRVWETGASHLDIRAEYAGILATNKKFEQAIEVLTSDQLTLDDRYLLASLLAGCERFDSAKRIYDKLVKADPTDIRAHKGVADLAAWTKDYPTAVQKYEAILRNRDWRDDPGTKVALAKALAWSGDHEKAIEYGKELLDELEKEDRRQVWQPILDSLAELKENDAAVQALIMQAYGERNEHAANPYFMEKLAECLMFAFDAEQAEPLVEQLVTVCPESHLLQIRYAQTLFTIGEFDQAAKYYSQLISSDSLPTDPVERGDVLLAAAYNSMRRGATSESSEQYQLARDCYIRFVEDEPLDSKYWGPFLDSVSGAKSYDNSVTLAIFGIYNARTSVDMDRKTRLRLADALATIREERHALRLLEEIAAGKEDVEVSWRRANLFLRMGRHDEAARYYDRLLQEQAFAGDSQRKVELLLAAASNCTARGLTTLANERYAQIMRLLRPKLRKQINQTGLWLPFLSAYSGMGGGSTEDAEIVMSIYANRAHLIQNVEFADRLKDVLLVSKEHKAALPLFELLMEKQTSRRLRLQYAQTLHTVGRHGAAENLFGKLMLSKRRGEPDATSPHDVARHEILISAAHNKGSLGEHVEAQALYGQTLAELEPVLRRDIHQTEYWSTFLLALSGQAKTVLPKHAKIANGIYRNRDLLEDNPEFVTNLGRVMSMMEEYRAAVDLLKRGVLQFENDRRIRTELARAYSELGEHREADIHYRWLLDRNWQPPTLLAETQLLTEAARNGQKIGTDERFESYASRALEILTRELVANPDASQLWQPFLDSAASEKELSETSQEITKSLFKRWRERSDDERFLTGLAELLVKSGDARRAIILLEQLGDTSPKSRFRLAMLHKDIGEYRQADKQFVELIEENPFSDDPLLSADLMLAAADNARLSNKAKLTAARFDEALRHMRKLKGKIVNRKVAMRYLDAIRGGNSVTAEDAAVAIEIHRRWADDKDPEIQTRLVDVMLKVDHPDEALPVLQSLASENPDAVPNQLRLANTLQSLEQHEEAALIFDRLLLEVGIDDSAMLPDLYAAAARSSLSRQRFAEARERFERLFELPVDREAFEFEYALALQKTGKPNEAIRMLEGKSDLTPEQELMLASMYLSSEEFDKAKSAYQRVLDVQPNNAKAQRGVADIAFWMEDYADAIKRYEALDDKNTSDPEFRESLASARLWKGEYQAALTEFTAMIKADPSRQALWPRFLEAAAAVQELTAYQRQTVNRIAGQVDKLTEGFAIKIQKPLLDVYTTHRDYDKALTLSKELRDASPEDQTLLAKHASLLGKLGKTDEALEIWKQLVSSNPTSESYRAQLANAYAVVKEDKLANEHYSALFAQTLQATSVEHGRRLLGAASVSKRLNRQAEALTRYDRAIDILLPHVDEGAGTTLWQPFLDAAASSSVGKLTPKVRETIGRIYKNRQDHFVAKDFSVRLADVLMRIDETYRALPILKELAAAYPQDTEIESRLAGGLLRAQDFASAIPMLERLANGAVDTEKWRGQLANALHSTEQFAKAERIYADLLHGEEGTAEERSKLLIQAARNSVKLNQFDKAKSRLAMIPEMLLADEELRAQYAGLLLRMGDQAKVTELLADQDRSTKTLEIVAGAYESVDDMESAERLYREILSKLPEDNAATHGLARIAMATDDFETAESLLNECIERDPADRSVLFDLGYAYLGMGDYEMAAETFLDLRHSSVNQRKVTTAYLQAVAGINSPEESHVDRAMEIFGEIVGGESEPLVISLADVLLRSEKYDEVLQLVRPLVPSNNGEIELRFAHASLNAGNAADAVRIYEANLQGNPDDELNKFLLAAALQKSGENVRAAKLFDELLRAERVRGKWFMLASDNADTMGDKAKGIEYAKSAAEYMFAQRDDDELPRSEYVHLIRAITRAGIDSPEADEAIDSVYQSVNKNSSGLLLAELAKALIDRKDISSAESIVKTLGAKDYGTLVTEKYGDLLVELRRYPEAIKVFQGLAVKANNASFDYRLGLLFARVGQFADALGYLSKLNESGEIASDDARFDVFTLALADAERRMAHPELANAHFESVAARYRNVVPQESATVDEWRKYLFAIRGVTKLSDPDKKLVRLAMGKLEMFAEDQEILESLSDFVITLDGDDPASAIMFINRVLGYYPDSIGVRYAKARAWLVAEKFDDADALLRELQQELQDPAAANSENEQVRKWTTPVGRSDINALHAQVHLNAKNFDAAIALFESSPELSKIDPLQYAWALMESGQIQSAIDWLKSNELEHPKRVAFLASLYLENNQEELAASTIESLLDKHENDFEVQRVVANVLFMTRQYEESVVLYELLTDRFPDDDEIRESLGKARLWIGNYEEADEILSDLVAKGSRSDLWVFALDAMSGSKLSSLEDEALLKIMKGYKQKEYKQQVRLAERLSSVYRHCEEPKLALEILRPYADTDDLRFKLEYGDVLSELTRHKEAIAVYQWCVKQRMEETEVIEESDLRLRYGDVLYRAKHFDEAQREFDFALANTDKTKPGIWRHALVSSAKNLTALDRVEEGLELFTDIYDAAPKEFDLYEEFAGALLEAERPEESLEWLLRGGELTLGGEYLLGAIYAKLSQFDRSRSVYMSIVKRYPEDLKAWHLLADVSTWAKDYQTAIHIYLQLLERDPDSEPLRIGLANAYLWSGRHQLAVDIYTKELSKNANRYDLWESFVHAASRKDVKLSNESYRLLVEIVRSRKRWPSNYAFRLQMVDGLFKVGDEKPAMMLLYSLLVERPHDRKLRRRYADELHRLGHYKQADRIYGELLRSKPLETPKQRSSGRTTVVGESEQTPRWKRPTRESVVN